MSMIIVNECLSQRKQSQRTSLILSNHQHSSDKYYINIFIYHIYILMQWQGERRLGVRRVIKGLGRHVNTVEEYTHQASIGFMVKELMQEPITT
jgi:hypothetical protein